MSLLVETVVTFVAFTTLTPIILLLSLFLYNRHKLHKNPPAPRKLPFVSIIIPAYNEEKSITNSICSVLALNYPKDKFEIIVVNDGSTDRTREICEIFQKRNEIKLINKENGGKGSALNFGVRVARGELVVCLDADSEPHPDALLKMISYFRSDDVACVTAAMKVKNKDSLLTGTQSIEYLSSIIMRKLLSFVNSIIVIPGPFSIYRRDILLKVGGFDEYNFTEDQEIALRFLDNGYKIQNCIDGYVYTLAPTTLKSLYRQRLRWSRGNIENAIKYKHLFFNIKNPYVGFIILPMFMASFGAATGTLAFFSYNLVKSVYNLVYYFKKLYLINFDIAPFLMQSQTYIKEQIIVRVLDLNVVNIIYMLIFTLAAVMLYITFKHSKENLKNHNKLSLLAYFFVYFTMLSITWCVAIVYNALGIKRQWGKVL